MLKVFLFLVLGWSSSAYAGITCSAALVVSGISCKSSGYDHIDDYRKCIIRRMGLTGYELGVDFDYDEDDSTDRTFVCD